MEKLAKEITRLRKRKRLSRHELSKFMGISDALVVNIESAKISSVEPDILRKFAKTLDGDFQDFLVLAGYMEKPDQENSNFIKVKTHEEKEEQLKYLEFIRSNHTHGYL